MMAKITELMNELKYPTDERGVCRGLALMAERARRCGQYEHFKERVDYLLGLQKGTLPHLINEAKKRAKAHETPGCDDALLLTVDSFFFQVSAYFLPVVIQSFLGIQGSHLSALDTRKLEEIMHEDQPLMIPAGYFLFTDVSDEKQNAVNHLVDFLQVIELSTASAGLLISSGGHVAHLFYMQDISRWFLSSHSTLTDYPSINKLIEPFITSFTNNGIIHLDIKVFVDDLPNKLGSVDNSLLEGQRPATCSRDPGISSNERTLCDHQDRAGSREQVEERRHMHCQQTLELLQKLKIISDNSLQSLLQNKNPNCIDSHRISSLWKAVQYNHLTVAKTLLSLLNLNEINLPGPDDATPLYMAAQNGHYELVEMLLKKLDVHSVMLTTHDGYSPLWTAAQNGHLNVLELLLKKLNGKGVNQAGNNGNTPLWIAAQNGHLSIVVVLLTWLDSRAVNKSDNDGFTPLFIAAQNGHLHVVRALLAKEGIDVNKTNKYGITPLEIARYKHHPDVVDELLRHQPFYNFYYTCLDLFANKSGQMLAIGIISLALLMRSSICSLDTSLALISTVGLTTYGIFQYKKGSSPATLAPDLEMK
jgi:ankyrin repeat protein